jgi:hypothetical protein
MKPHSYEMIIWWSQADDAYVVDVPELPGCMAPPARRPSRTLKTQSGSGLKPRRTTAWKSPRREGGWCLRE